MLIFKEPLNKPLLQFASKLLPEIPTIVLLATRWSEGEGLFTSSQLESMTGLPIALTPKFSTIETTTRLIGKVDFLSPFVRSCCMYNIIFQHKLGK